MIILAIDPSVRNFAMVTMEIERGAPPLIQRAFVVQTHPIDGEPKGLGNMRRIQLIEHALTGEILWSCGATKAIAIEASAIVRGKQRLETVMITGRVRGLVDAASYQFKLPVAEVQPVKVKQVATGTKTASKDDMIKAVSRLVSWHGVALESLKSSWQEHVADAVAVGVAASEAFLAIDSFPAEHPNCRCAP